MDNALWFKKYSTLISVNCNFSKYIKQDKNEENLYRCRCKT